MKCMYTLFLAIAIFNTSVSNNLDPMNPSFLLELIRKMESGENVTFTKYGDGEYLCMRGDTDYNIDHDSYHPWLANALKNALISLCNKKNTYIGLWWTPNERNFCDEIVKKNDATIPWAWYHMVMNDDEFYKYDYMHKFVGFLVKTTRKKILICNSMNNRLKSFFKANVYIEIPAKNWSFEYDKWRTTIMPHIEKDAIVLISGGMCSKVLINDITNNYDVTCIDLGSSFDILGRKINTRGWKHTLQMELNYYKEYIPSDWK